MNNPNTNTALVYFLPDIKKEAMHKYMTSFLYSVDFDYFLIFNVLTVLVVPL